MRPEKVERGICLPINLIDPNPWNPNKPSDRVKEAIAESLETYDQLVDLIVRPHPELEGRYQVIDGEHRLKLVQGDRAYATIVHGLEEADCKKLTVILNETRGRADDIELSKLLSSLEEFFGDDLRTALPYTEDELQALLKLAEGEPPSESKEAAGGAIEDVKPRVGLVPGSIWQLGQHRLLCGDSCDRENIKRLVGNLTPTFIHNDPPYGISIVKAKKGEATGEVGSGGKFKGTIGSGKLYKTRQYHPVYGDDSIDTAIASCNLCLELFPEATMVFWGANYYAHALPPSSCWVVWDKQNDGTDFADAELAWTNSETAIRIFRHVWNGMLRGSENNQPRTHPNQKPVALGKFIFEKYGKPGDVIVDQFAGSGMSLWAAVEMGDRSVLCAEYSEVYCELILSKFEQITGIEPNLLKC